MPAKSLFALSLAVSGLMLFSACSSTSDHTVNPETTLGQDAGTNAVVTPPPTPQEAGASNGAQRNTYGGGAMQQYEGTNGNSKNAGAAAGSEEGGTGERASIQGTTNTTNSGG